MDQEPQNLKPKKNKSAAKEPKSKVKAEFISEWKLFWAGLLGEEPEIEKRDEKLISKVHELSQAKIKTLIKTLSDDRHSLNHELERVIEETDLLTSKLEAQRLVGGDISDLEKSLVELNNLGESLTLQLEQLDQKLKIIRQRDNDLKLMKKLSKIPEL